MTNTTEAARTERAAPGRRLVAAGFIRRRAGRTITVRATPASVTGTITTHRPAEQVWSIRELNHLYEQHGGAVTLTPADTSTVRITLTTPSGRTVTTEWQPADEPHGFTLPAYRAHLAPEVAR